MSTWRMLVRGALRRCPVCGQGRIFRRWFQMAERCPRCGLRFERIEGHWVGSLGLNTIVTFGTLLLVVAAGLILAYPDYDVLALTLLSMATTVIVPIVFFPFSRTLWTAVDLAMRPVEPWEVDGRYLQGTGPVEAPEARTGAADGRDTGRDAPGDGGGAGPVGTGK